MIRVVAALFILSGGCATTCREWQRSGACVYLCQKESPGRQLQALYDGGKVCTCHVEADTVLHDPEEWYEVEVTGDVKR